VDKNTNVTTQKDIDRMQEVTEQANLDAAFLLAYQDARGSNNRVMNREDFRKGWNQCLVALGITMQVSESVWKKS
jgi:5-keto 4-deoxyuronate isomerase